MIIFIAGYPRSGTTLMKQILGKHPAIYAFRELHFFEHLWAPTKEQTRLAPPQALDLTARLYKMAMENFSVKKDAMHFYPQPQDIIATLPPDEHAPLQVYRHFLTSVTAAQQKTIPCDKTPRYVYYLQDILDLMPDAKIINLIRDPRAVLCSQKHNWRRFRHANHAFSRMFRTWIHYHPLVEAFCWKQAVKTAKHYPNGHARVYSVKFEELLTEPEGAIQGVCQFLGVPYAPEMLQVSGQNSSFRTAPEQVGIDRSPIERWKRGGLNSAEIFLIQLMTAKIMQQCDYLPAKIVPNPARLLFTFCTFPLKFGLSFLLHLAHVQNLSEALRRRLNVEKRE